MIAMEISGDINDKKRIAEEKLNEVGFDQDKMNRIVSKLSGGEQQRVAIARSIATNPKLILADEPTGNLDNETEQDIIKIFKDLALKQNKCVIVVTHSNEVEKEADINIKLSDGKFVIS
jgi:putative ABC transport system ATP-binding protein